ncbi:hypothetical protein [Paenibacillus sp. CF384]|uniref:hypothetical protein n=1 Tax=Paenibacillus sp. CF384 TaxID=1884382 RepID=UPI00089B2026|nr:hypothetical protein [Paenibacillus sp. CF384]SDW82484.1 hypothetical protein SAMN05518855_1005257 [Paenibacillus sp. CF384]
MAEIAKKVNISLSAPEFTYFNEIKYSVGNDPLVQVDPLRRLASGNYLVTLRVKGTLKAKALATLLVLNRNLGSYRIFVRVRDSQGKLLTPITNNLTPRAIAILFRRAFSTNRLFKFVAVRDTFGLISVYPVFKVFVVQFYNDDLSDFYSNYNNVAAAVFRNVLRKSIQRATIQCSTARKK